MASIGARAIRHFTVGLAIAIAGAALGGCSDTVEVNSRLLDSVGLSTAALSGRAAEPKMPQRAPLVMPPSTQKLPEPGSSPPPPEPVADASWPKDKDQEKVAEVKERARKQAQYCRDGNWKERSMDSTAGTQGPEGQCGTIFSVIGGFFSNGGNAPEPDVMHGRTQ
jgi:hypothetical protein